MSGKLSRKQAAALITAVETTAKGMSSNEKKNSPMTKELIAINNFWETQRVAKLDKKEEVIEWSMV